MHTGVIIALLPEDGVGEEHMTLVYAGNTDRLVSVPESMMRETCARLAKLFLPPTAIVLDHTVFGPEGEQVNVALIDGPMLHQLRACVEFMHNSEYGLRPHITAVNGVLRPIGSPIRFNRIASWYGEERHEFFFGRNYPLRMM